ncbi:hypothetical protein PV326_010199 [Microctonus aethiopoides]|nr:hypothetical protein PV326_010199 [Microctonus aethiopoides]
MIRSLDCALDMPLQKPSCGNCPINKTACLADHCVPADGLRRGILTANRQLPGPSIQVCENDILVVDVVNRLPGKATAIHWRGQNQKETPCMDGVPLVTQCPIPSYTTFQYKFRASVPGTHLWHSHSGADVANGIFGSLIVRQADVREPHRKLYDVDDPDNVLLISHWHHSIVMDNIATSHGNKKPAILLINGRGRNINGPEIPLSQFNVKSNYKYRFRVGHAGGAGACPVTLSIEKHSLLLIALDGYPVKPNQVNSITLAIGERADFVLNADKSIGTYQIDVHTIKGCSAIGVVTGTAFIKYTTSNENINSLTIDNEDEIEIIKNKFNDKIQMTTNPVDKCGINGHLCITEMHSIQNLPSPLNSLQTDVTIYLSINQEMHSFDTSGSDLETKVLNVNNATFTYPSSPLLTQSSDVPDEMMCSENAPKISTNRCRRSISGVTTCECVNTKQIPLGSTVEIIFLDQVGRDDLVYHLHGYNFYIVGARKFNYGQSMDELKKLNKRGILFNRNLNSPPLKDTVVIPKFSAVAIRFKADNPGYWILRDENSIEWTRGMDIILQVGEPSDMVPPPQDFPKCGSFVGPDYFLI